MRWIVLPNGVVGDDLKLSIVATTAGSPRPDWPALLADLPPRRLVSADGSLDLPLTITSTAAPMVSTGFDATSGSSAADIADAARELDELERSMARLSPAAWPSAGDATALGVVGEMAATRRRGRVPVGAITRVAGGVPERHDVDRFARPGLRIDATVPRFEGEHVVRVVAADGSLLDGPVRVGQPWTLVRSDPSGWIVVPRDGGRRYRPDVTLTRLPVTELSEAVDALAQELAAAGPDHRVVLPQLRDGAFTLAMRPGVPPDESEGVLHAEDLTRGMQAEVAIDGGAFHPIGEGPVVTWEGTDGAGPRYGDHIRFAVRGVDLAGNVMHGSDHVVSHGRYLRRSAVDAPAILGTGTDEVLDVVVRSDGDGCPIGPRAEWTIVPPELDPRTATRHGIEPSADPAAAGLALIGLPGRSQPVVIPFAGVGSKNQLRLSIRAAIGDEVMGDDVVVDHDVGSDLVELLVPPGLAATFELASPVAGDALQDLYVGDLPPTTLLDGSAVMRCRRRRVSVLHAVQRPAVVPTAVHGPTVEVPQDHGLPIAMHAAYGMDGCSTGHLHVDARWTDLVDDGSGPMRHAGGRQRVASIDVGADQTVAELTAVLDLDCRRRSLALRPIASSRFAEHFELDDDGIQRRGDEFVVVVPNRERPPALRVVSSEHRSTSGTRQVRVVLARPWFVTGPEERLGVVVHPEGSRWSPSGGSWWEVDDARGPLATAQVLAGTDITDAVVGVPVRFDEALDAWVADLELAVPDRAVVHLAVARFQPVSASGCHLSSVTDLVLEPRVGVPA